MTDPKRTPLAVIVSAANEHDINFILPLVYLRLPVIGGKPGRPLRVPRVVRADCGCQSRLDQWQSAGCRCDLEANAAMKSIVRRDTGDDWREFVRKLYEVETGISDPDDEELRRFDKQRKNKKVSNAEWVNPNDLEATTGKMKDGRTRFKYKAEHAVDLETTAIVAAEIYHGDQSDHWTIQDTVNAASTHLRESGNDAEVTKVVADKGYHSADTIRTLEEDEGLLTYIPEREQATHRKWTDKSEGSEGAFRRNRQRIRRRYGRKLQRWRSERVERTFAHICTTGGCRRSWLRGRANVHKRYLIAAAGYNLGLILRKLLGAGKPKHLSALAERLLFIWFTMLKLLYRSRATPRSETLIGTI